MSWDTIENRWKQFIDVLGESKQNPANDNVIMATSVQNEADVNAPDELNDLPDTDEFGDEALQIYRPIASNRQQVDAPVEPMGPIQNGEDKAPPEPKHLVFDIRARMQHKSGQSSVHSNASRRHEQ
jgi:hypothetical protein